MSTTIDKTVSVLHDLVRTCKDGEEGYRLAADKNRSADFSALLMQHSSQRGRMGADLALQLRQMGDESSDGGTPAAALFRGWINLRSALSHGNPEVILAECERGEDMAVRAYEEALKSDLRVDVRFLIEKQFRMVLEARDRIRSLRGQKQRIRFKIDASNPNTDVTTEGAPD